MGFDRDALIGALDHHDGCDHDVTEADDPDMGWCYRMRERQADRILALMSNADVMDGWRSEWGDDADYATPPQGIDRDALRERFTARFEDFLLEFDPGGFAEREQVEGWAAELLALVRPVEGITLTPEEVARVRQWHSYAARYMTSDDDALAERLEKGTQ